MPDTLIKHTPGPWTNDDGDIRNASGNLVATVYGPADFPCFAPDTEAEYNAAIEEAEVNADMVAATPDLLDVVRRYAEIMQGSSFRGGNPSVCEELNFLKVLANDALAKARGKGNR